MQKVTLCLQTLLCLFFVSCGSASAPEILVNLVPGDPNPFELQNLEKLLFFVTDVSNTEEVVVFPDSCVDDNGGLIDGCGFDLNSAAEFRLNLESIPDNATIRLTVSGRDLAGNELFTGVSNDFLNSEATGTVNINVEISGT